MAAGDSLDHSGFFQIWAKSLLWDKDGRITGLHVSYKPFWLFETWPAPREAVLKKVRPLFGGNKEVQNPAEEGFVQSLWNVWAEKDKFLLMWHDEAMKFIIPPHIVPPVQHFGETVRQPAVLQRSSRWGSTTHERYPWHQCKSHTLCQKQVVKFRYRITEEKHTNTTVKSSHYGKIESIEY